MFARVGGFLQQLRGSASTHRPYAAFRLVQFALLLCSPLEGSNCEQTQEEGAMRDRLGSRSLLQSGSLLLLSAILVTGACAGIVYWAWQGSLIGVVVSALVPGCFATSVLDAGAARIFGVRKA